MYSSLFFSSFSKGGPYIFKSIRCLSVNAVPAGVERVRQDDRLTLLQMKHKVDNRSMTTVWEREFDASLCRRIIKFDVSLPQFSAVLWLVAFLFEQELPLVN